MLIGEIRAREVDPALFPGMRGAFLVIIIASELHNFVGTRRPCDSYSSMKNVFLSGRRSPELALAAVGFFGFHFLGHAQAATINAASPSLVDVTAAIVSASDGDTVIVPAGTASWTLGLVVTKGITLMGQTTTDPANKTAIDNTIIQDNVSRVVGHGPLIVFRTVLGKSYRLSGITFSTGTITDTQYNGAIQLYGTSQSVRIDHCHFNDLAHQNECVRIWDWPMYGVIDHNLFDFSTSTDRFSIVYWSSGYGDSSWTQPAFYGSEKFMFVEDNCFNNTSGNDFVGYPDGWNGGRWVMRYNHCYDVTLNSNHGTEYGRNRGGRCLEMYNNDFHWSHTRDLFGIRTGGFITHDNTHDGSSPSPFRSAGLQVYRQFEASQTWGGATGDNPWDVNVTESDGTHVDGHPPYLFDNGIVTSGSCSALTDSTKSWTTNQWLNYAVKRVSDMGISGIVSNTGNSVNVSCQTVYGGSAVWQVGDDYQIHRVLIVLDQPGRGAGDLITGDTPINSTTGTAAWPNQALEPCYAWNDIYTPSSTRLDVLPTNIVSSDVLQSGRDFYNNTPMPGYTPYTYPHPLVSGGGHGPPSPGDLHIVP